MKKDLAIIGGLLLVVLTLVVFGGGFSSTSFVGNSNTSSSTRSASNAKDVIVNVKGLNVNAQVARSQDERRKGLGKKESLPISEGMLFIFEKNGVYPIWMKDMKFPIDIIWIDANKKIVAIAENAAPEPEKKDRELKIYNPNSNSLYVLEVNAGLSALNGLQAGDIVDFSL